MTRDELKQRVAAVVEGADRRAIGLWLDLGRMLSDGEDPEVAFAEYERRLRLWQETGMAFRSAGEPPPLGASACATS